MQSNYRPTFSHVAESVDINETQYHPALIGIFKE